MHPSSHAFTSAFLPLYFFVDTNTQQCFKNIHTKKAALHPSQVCPGCSRRHIALFANVTGLPLMCCVYLARFASANPSIYSFTCAPSSLNAKPLFQQQKSKQRLTKIINVIGSIAFPGGERMEEAHFIQLFILHGEILIIVFSKTKFH